MSIQHDSWALGAQDSRVYNNGDIYIIDDVSIEDNPSLQKTLTCNNGVAIIDLVLIGDTTINYANVSNLTVINGELTIHNGADSGGNTGIIFVNDDSDVSTPSEGCQTVYFEMDDAGLEADDAGVVFASLIDQNVFYGTAVITNKPMTATKVAIHWELELLIGKAYKILGTRNRDVFLQMTITITSDQKKALSTYATVI